MWWRWRQNFSCLLKQLLLGAMLMRKLIANNLVRSSVSSRTVISQQVLSNIVLHQLPLSLLRSKIVHRSLVLRILLRSLTGCRRGPLGPIPTLPPMDRPHNAAVSVPFWRSWECGSVFGLWFMSEKSKQLIINTGCKFINISPKTLLTK